MVSVNFGLVMRQKLLRLKGGARDHFPSTVLLFTFHQTKRTYERLLSTKNETRTFKFQYELTITDDKIDSNDPTRSIFRVQRLSLN